jgi:hypothetical protein
MLLEHHEDKDLNFAGTIIDIETTGEYCRAYKIRDTRIPRDSREYKDLKIVIFGYMNKKGLHIFCASGNEDIPELEKVTKQLLVVIVNERPLYAFNCHQEMSVFYHHLNLEIRFDKELQSEEFENKEKALRSLGILDSYGDPFHNEYKPGNSCRIAWENDYFEKAIQHNRACLLKEHELLLKGRGIVPIPLEFKTINSSLTKAFEIWTKSQEDYIKKAWSDGKTLIIIAQSEECKRTPRAVWLRLQRLNVISPDIPYTIEKNSCTIRDLPY